MKASDELFHLIKSLDKNEKRYFKLFASLRPGKKNYLTLFEAMEKQETYDEQKLKETLKGEGFIKRLPFEKVFLFDHLLKSLENYHAGSVDARLQSMLRQIKVLIDKGLYVLADKQVKKALQLAQEHDKFATILQIIDYRDYLGRRMNHVPDEESKLLVKDTMNKYKNVKEYELLATELMTNYQGSNRDPSRKKAMQEFLQQSMLSNDENALSGRAMYYFYSIHGISHNILGNTQQAHDSNKKLIELLEQHPQRIADDPSNYIAVLHNHIISLKMLGLYKQIPNGINKLRNLPVSSLKDKYNIESFTNTEELAYCINTAQFEKGLDLIKKIETWFLRTKSKVGREDKWFLFYHAAYLYFLTGNYSSAMTYLNRIINEPQKDFRNDLQSAARILSLFIYYEKKDPEFLAHLVRSVYRFLYKKNRLYKFETVLLDFIRKKLPKVYSERQVREAFIQLKSTLVALSTDDYEKSAFKLIEIISWLESKIENRPFAEVVREKALKKKF